MAEMIIEVEQRKQFGGNASRQMRRRGLVPGIVYGQGKENIPIAVDPRRIREIRRSETGENTICRLQVAGFEADSQVHMMLRDVQLDPVTERLLHVDFLRLDMTRTLEVKVPIELVGTSPGVKDMGGILDFIHRELLLECLPGDIPAHITADISALELGKSIRVGELVVGEGRRVLDREDVVVVVIHAPKLVAVAEEGAEGEVAAAPVAEGEASAEPEVIKKGKAVKEGAE